MREGRPPPSADSREREREMGGWGKAGEEGEIFFFSFSFPSGLRRRPPSAPQHQHSSPSPPPLARLGGFFHQPRCGRHRKEGEEVVLFPFCSKKISPSQPRRRKGRGSLPLSTSSQKTYSGTESGKWWRERETISPPPKTPPSLFRAPPPASESKLNSMAVVAGILPFLSSLLPEP